MRLHSLMILVQWYKMVQNNTETKNGVLNKNQQVEKSILQIFSFNYDFLEIFKSI
jgi:hypothetical protein